MAGIEEMKKLSKRMSAVAKAFSANKTFDLRKMSNDAAEDAALEFNRDLAEISVAAYALHKLLGKEHVRKNPKWAKAKGAMEKSLVLASETLAAGREQEFRKHLKTVGARVTALDTHLGNYVQKTFGKARVKQASRAYALGLSLSSAGELMGADPGRLQGYVGFTKIHEEPMARKSVKARLKLLKEALG